MADVRPCGAAGEEPTYGRCRLGVAMPGKDTEPGDFLARRLISPPDDTSGSNDNSDIPAVAGLPRPRADAKAGHRPAVAGRR